MSILIPYLTIVVILVFFWLLCYAMFHKAKPKGQTGRRRRMKSNVEKMMSRTQPIPTVRASTTAERQEKKEETNYVTTKGEAIRENGSIQFRQPEPKKTAVSQDTIWTREHVLELMRNAKSLEEASEAAKRLQQIEATASKGVKEEEKTQVLPTIRSSEAMDMEKTQVIKKVESTFKEDLEKTRIMPPITEKETPIVQKEVQSVAPVEAIPQKVARTVEERCVQHFMSRYGMLSRKAEQHVAKITAEAFAVLGNLTEAEKEELISNLSVQEALQSLQHAYAAQPNELTRYMGIRAFQDILLHDPGDTQYIVAYDALKIMQHLQESQYKILGILMLFMYSRNSHNVNIRAFRQYVKKYVVPLLDHIRTDDMLFHQLVYLRCIVTGANTRFADIMADSYPLLFRYSGFREEELRQVLQGEKIPAEYIVHSFNSPLYKFACIDESMAPQFFANCGVDSSQLQRELLNLMKKRPVSLTEQEEEKLFYDLDPVLGDCNALWNTSQFATSTLSLMGLYLGQVYVAQIIGEEFDISRWM